MEEERKAAREVQKSSEGNLAYATCSVAPKDLSFRDFRVRDFPGLVAAHVVRRNDSSLVVLIWKNAGYAGTKGPDVQERLHLGAVYWEGAIADTAVLKPPLLKRFSVTKAIIGIAAVFGALTAIRDYYAELFVSPRVQMTISSAEPVDYASGTQVRIPFRVLNLGRYGPAHVELQGATLRPLSGGAETPLTLDRSAIPQLIPGSNEEAMILGTAPSLPGPSVPVPYELTVIGEASVGMFVPDEDIHASRTVNLWADIGWRSKLTPGTSIGRLLVVLYPGRDQKDGLKGSITVRSPVRLDRANLKIDNAEESDTTCTSARTDCKVDFTTGPLVALKEQSYSLTIPAEGRLKPEQWAELGRNTEVFFR